MASRQPDRCIPNVWDVFGAPERPSSEVRGNSKTEPLTPAQNTAATERELKHIEKRMSMKKTIRKQISRQLAQAFVENPDLLRDDGRLDCNRNDCNRNNSHNFTLTKSKMTRNDANFLDLLRGSEEAHARRLSNEVEANAIHHHNHINHQHLHQQPPPQMDASKKTSFWKRLWSNKR